MAGLCMTHWSPAPGPRAAQGALPFMSSGPPEAPAPDKPQRQKQTTAMLSACVERGVAKSRGMVGEGRSREILTWPMCAS